jgi:hypothetical protein
MRLSKALVGLWLVLFAPAVQAQVGPRTTGQEPPKIKLYNVPSGIQLVRFAGLSPTAPAYPTPAVPLEVGSGTSNIEFLTATMNGKPIQRFCRGGRTCAVAVRYKVGTDEKSIYLVRAGGKLIVVAPDGFAGNADGAVLQGGSIQSIQELGGKSAPMPADTQMIVEFRIKR